MPRRTSRIRRRMSRDLDEIAEKAQARAEAQKALREAEAEFRHAIFRAWDGGWTIDEIAPIAGLGRARIHQIVREQKDD
jgi:DNA-directed RNA polymerase specialized sigma24 family protein